MKIVLLLLAVAAVSFLLTGIIRRYALVRNLLDIPNERSSHQVPTPRGGGLAIVVPFLSGVLLLAIWGTMPHPLAGGLLGGGGWVALVGFLDDRKHIPARWRLLAHFAGAVWVLAWLGVLPHLPVFGLQLSLGWFGLLLAAVYLVWLLNLYNFMDGIDGIAGIEAITVCLSGGFLVWLAAPEMNAWVWPIVLAAAVAGFLPWNWPPARIFMGDSGSGFLGLMLGVLSLQAAQVAPDLFWCWVILLGVFVVDATVTLLRRVRRGEKFYEAHRCHAYQYAARRFGAHRPVSLAVGMINIFWLLPVAVMVANGWLAGLAGMLIAYAPLVWCAFRFEAGAKERQQV
ncbi:MAG: MraY family glycosyltransferase [Desulfurivibrionaceae bacterium]